MSSFSMAMAIDMDQSTSYPQQHQSHSQSMEPQDISFDNNFGEESGVASANDSSANGTGAAGSGTSEGSKRKGARRLTTLTRRPGACDACHLRRVKCERMNDDVACYNCIDRKQKCTVSRPTKRGKRPEPSQVPNITRQQRQSKTTTGTLNDVVALTNINIGDRSVSNRVARKELTAGFTSHLLQLQNEIHPWPVTHFVWASFNREFELSGRRPEIIGPAAEVVCAILIAYGARATHDSVVLGREASRMEEQWGQNLVQYGKLRDQACRTLVERAKSLATDNGLMRTATLENIAALTLLEQLIDLEDPTCTKGRPYLIQAASHMKTLLYDKNLPESTRQRILFRLAPFVTSRDASTAVASGQPLALSSQDLKVFFPEGQVDFKSFVSTNFRDLVGCVGSLAQMVHLVRVHLTALSRSFVVNLSGPIARQKSKVDLDYVHRFWVKLTQLKKDLRITQSRVIEKVGESGRDWWTPLQCLMARLIFTCHEILSQRLKDQNEVIQELASDGTVLDPNSEMAVYQRELTDAWLTSHHRVRDELRFLAACAKNVLEESPGNDVPRLMSMRYIYNALQQLTRCVERILGFSLTTDSQGNNEIFDMREGLAELQWVLKGMRSLAWGWQDVNDFADSLETGFSRLRIDDAGPTPSIAATSALVGVSLAPSSSLPAAPRDGSPAISVANSIARPATSHSETNTESSRQNSSSWNGSSASATAPTVDGVAKAASWQQEQSHQQDYNSGWSNSNSMPNNLQAESSAMGARRSSPISRSRYPSASSESQQTYQSQSFSSSASGSFSVPSSSTSFSMDQSNPNEEINGFTHSPYSSTSRRENYGYSNGSSFPTPQNPGLDDPARELLNQFLTTYDIQDSTLGYFASGSPSEAPANPSPPMYSNGNSGPSSHSGTPFISAGGSSSFYPNGGSSGEYFNTREPKSSSQPRMASEDHPSGAFDQFASSGGDYFGGSINAGAESNGIQGTTMEALLREVLGFNAQYQNSIFNTPAGDDGLDMGMRMGMVNGISVRDNGVSRS